MATITSSGSGNWSSGSTWVGGAVPGDGDSVVIDAGHTVVFDVDQSSFVTGVSIMVNGTLTFAADGTVTYCKLVNLQVNGSLHIGTEEYPIPMPSSPAQTTVTIDLAHSTAIEGDDISVCGVERAAYRRIASKSDNTTIVLEGDGDLEWLTPGDIISISNSTIYGPGEGPPETFTVSSYSPSTRTVVLASELTRDINQNGATDYVALISRPITIKDADMAIITHGLEQYTMYGETITGVCFSNCDRLFAYPDGATLKSATVIADSVLESYGEIPVAVAEDVTVCGYYLPAQKAVRCISQYSEAGVAGATTGDHLSVDSVINNCYGALASISNNFVVYNGVAQNNYGYGLIDAAASCTIKMYNCVAVNNSGAGWSLSKGNNCAGWLLSGCTTDWGPIEAGFNEFYTPKTAYIDIRDWQGIPGNDMMYVIGGYVDTITDGILPPGEGRCWRHNCTSAAYPIYMHRRTQIAPGGTLQLNYWLRKDVAMSWLPRIQIISPSQDPLWVSGMEPLAEAVMTDSVDEWESGTLSYTNASDVAMEVLVRSIAMNDGGHFYCYYTVAATGGAGASAHSFVW